MSKQNIMFVIVTPIVLAAIITAFVVSIGEALLAMHHWAQVTYFVGDHPTPELNRYWREIAALYPVAIALGLSTLFLVGGTIASMLAPQPKSSTSAH